MCLTNILKDTLKQGIPTKATLRGWSVYMEFYYYCYGLYYRIKRNIKRNAEPICVGSFIILIILILTTWIFIPILTWVNTFHATETVSIVISNPIAGSISVSSVCNYEVIKTFTGGAGVGIGLPQVGLSSLEEFKKLIPSNAIVFTYVENKYRCVERHYVVIVNTTLLRASLLVVCPGLRPDCNGRVVSFTNEVVIFEYLVREKIHPNNKIYQTKKSW